MKVDYAFLFPEELKQRISEKPVAFLPLGSLEYHGYHNVLGLDTLKAWRLCQLACEKIGGVVLPPLYLGVDAWPDIDLQKYPNKQYDCYHVDALLYEQLLKGYFQRIARIGFKKLFVLAGHYPNADFASKASRDFREMEIIVAKEPDLVEGEQGDHAGKWETSLMMVLFPELVDLNRGKGKEDRLWAIEGVDPVESSPEYGKEMIEKIIARITALLS